MTCGDQVGDSIELGSANSCKSLLARTNVERGDWRGGSATPQPSATITSRNELARTLDETACDHRVEIEGRPPVRSEEVRASDDCRSAEEILPQPRGKETARSLYSPGITVDDSHKRDGEATKA